MSFARRTVIALGGLFAVLLLWHLAAIFVGDTARLVPTPISAFVRCFDLLLSGELNSDITATISRWLAGFVLAVLIGAPLGLAIGVSPFLHQALSIIIDFLRSLPVTALFPVFLVFFGVGDLTMIAMSFTATVFIVAVNGIYGVQSAPPTRRNMAASFGARRWQIFWRITAMDALHHIFIGMRTTLSLSLIVAIVSEMFIGASHGLGQRLYLSYQLQQVADLYGLIIIVGTLGFVANWLFAQLERKVVFWVFAQ